MEQARELKTEFYQLIKIYFTDDVNVSPYRVVIDPQNTTANSEQMISPHVRANPHRGRKPVVTSVKHDKNQTREETTGVDASAGVDSDSNAFSIDSEDDLPSFSDIFSSPLPQ